MKSVVNKLISLIITVLVISFVTFIVFSIIPGNAAIAKLGVDASPEQIERLEEEMGLNDPIVLRYGKWLLNALKGDFGESLQYSGTKVSALLSSRLQVTLVLSLLSMGLILLFSFPISLLCVRHQGKWVDALLSGLGQVLMAVPAFFLGIMITYLLGLVLHFFKPGAYIPLSENPSRAVLYLLFPAISIALPKISMTVRFLKSSIQGELSQDYVRTARSHGMSQGKVLSAHVLKNALIPVITFLATIIAEIMAGSIVAEQVFSVPGIGRLLITSISARDFPVVQAIVMYITSVVVTAGFVMDILYILVDPRLRRK
ncbi:MAG: ABC transporter permease [Firmicutes bacterium]|nr:ABC transporter permease [Bacillota bacterium]